MFSWIWNDTVVSNTIFLFLIGWIRGEDYVVILGYKLLGELSSWD